MTQLTNEQVERLAKARVSFRVHALVYVAVNLFLAALWAVTMSISRTPWSLASFWPIWTLLGWGVGLLIHGFVVYGAGTNWQAREEERIRRSQPPPPGA